MTKLPKTRIEHPHVIRDPAVYDDSPVIAGTRVPVRRLFGWHRQGTTVETLIRRYPQLGPARILDALAFAYDNLELMTADLLRERETLARDSADMDRIQAETKDAKQLSMLRKNIQKE
jgi:uncharacterized protein (DUF433 family)